MSTDLKRRNVPFSPPDMTEAEANEVRDAILSGWITTGPRTKKLEKLIAKYVGVNDTYSNSAITIKNDGTNIKLINSAPCEAPDYVIQHATFTFYKYTGGGVQPS